MPVPAEQQPANLLIITVDDMSADSVGVFGAGLAGTTPNIDALAARGLRFDMAHVQVANCMPSRNVMWTGLYPHSNRVEGFFPVKDADYPTLMGELKKSGYFTAVRNKVKHSTPYSPWAWDRVLDQPINGEPHHAKDPESYGSSVRAGIEEAALAGKPFFLLVNIDDPHLPFYGRDRSGNPVDDPFHPSRVFTPEEVPVPGFLFDNPVVRQEVARYYSTVRRADDAVGEVMAALKAMGKQDSTIVLFLSDHGMPLPFAKTQLYHHSTRTPLVVVWPGQTDPGSVNNAHMVSAVDLMPTILEGLSLPLPEGLQGRSFLPLLSGGAQSDRQQVFKSYNENRGGQRRPMRAVETPELLYIFNPWAAPPPPEIFRPWSVFRPGMHSAAMGTRSWREMATLGKYDRRLAWRADLFRHRVPQELYDVRSDPNCLVNLIHEPEYASDLAELQSHMEHWMRETGDHALEAFVQREDRAALDNYMRQQEEQAIAQKRNARREAREAIARAMRESMKAKPEAQIEQ
ncbi:MAG: sulfatase family protein [Halioglobus sp.]